MPDNFLNATVLVFLSERYGILETSVENRVLIEIEPQFSTPPTSDYDLSITASLDVTNYPLGASVRFWGRPAITNITLPFPANGSVSRAEISATLSGTSVLWKNSIEIPFVSVTSTLGLPVLYKLIVMPPSGGSITSIFSARYPGLSSVVQHVASSTEDRFVIPVEHPLSPIVVLYQSQNWDILALVGILVAMVFLYLAVKYGPSLRSMVRQRTPPPILPVVSGVLKRVAGLDSRKLLSAFMLLAIIMLSLSLAFGPDPRTRIYALASPSTAELIDDSLPDAIFVLSVNDEMNEFPTLAALGSFSAVVVADFIPPTTNVAETFIFPAMASAPQVFILSSHADPFMAAEAAERFPDKVVDVPNLDALQNALTNLTPKPNLLGLDLTPNVFLIVVGLVGVASLLLMLLGFAFLSSRLIDLGRKRGVSAFPEALASVIFLFVFIQVIYVTCTVLLQVPLGLHTSSSKVTALGVLGLGGGSRPRMIASLVGFFFGSILSLRDGLRVDRLGVVLFIFGVAFLLFDPLSAGQTFNQFVLLFTTGPQLEQSSEAWTSIRAYLGTNAESFGAWASETYAISLGIILYYGALIPFFLFARLERTSRTLLLLVTGFASALGGIRVADMAPWKTLASIVPGFMTGLVMASGFIIFSVAEKWLRSGTHLSLRLPESEGKLGAEHE